jgi:two-component system chemotaxis sensor kinase CheA
MDNFLEELTEKTHSIETVILRLKKDPENKEDITLLLRDLHTIKGSSRMLKVGRVEKIAHGLESVFKGIQEERYPLDSQLVRLVLLTADYLKAEAQNIRQPGSRERDLSPLLNVYDHVYQNEPWSLEVLAPPPDEVQAAGNVRIETPLPPSAGEQETIRVKVSHIDAIIKSLNNLIIRQFQFKKQNDRIRELEELFQELTQVYQLNESRAAFEKTAADCRQRIQQIRKHFTEEMPLLERSSFEVQEEILSLRMLPLELVLGSLGPMVEETAIRVGKKIDLAIKGSDLMIDKMILENLYDPVIHLVRNAVDHGIENPEERARAGKPATGSVSIGCSAESGNIVIRIRDDGRGLDYEKIRAKARKLYPHMDEEITIMDNGALNGFLFQSGFSTREQVSDLSGRGVGLDIVRYNMEKIKGKITVDSTLGSGTEFILTLPLSLATVDGFFISAGGEKFLVPSNYVREIIIAADSDLLDLLNRKAIRLRDRIIPVYSLTDLLGLTPRNRSGKHFILITESLGDMIGIIIDSIIQFASLVFKPLPKSLGGLKVLQGVVFDESYNIVNILSIPEIMNRFKRIKNIDSFRKFSADRSEYKHILVVDDSLSTREIERSILEMENYNVETAVDGIDALGKCRERYYNLIISDIQMPRMDGLTFIENLRKDEKYNTTPVIVVSAVNNPEKQEQFRNLGVEAFIVKADFDRGNLVDEVHRLIG